jgi:hypothetical protein
MLRDEISIDRVLHRGGPQTLCAVCRYRDAPSIMCRHCHDQDQHGQGQSQAVWNGWMEREQKDYYTNGGCTSVNLNGKSVYIKTKYPIRPDLFLLKRVKACIGWAIHGLLMEFTNGTRVGYVVDLTSIRDDAAIAKRNGGDWVDIDTGDYVTNVQGFHLSRNCFLCHTLQLQMASGRTITFESNHAPWKGEPFSHSLPPNALLSHVSFQQGNCVGVTAVETYLHLPIKSSNRVGNLQVPLQKHFQFLQLVAHRVDFNLQKQGECKPLGRDIWNTILLEYLTCQDLQLDIPSENH